MDETERRLREQLRALQREYQERAEPIIHALAELDAIRAARNPMLMTVEKARELGII